MTTPSPSEFLTFMRHVTVRSSVRTPSLHAHHSIASAAGCGLARRRYATSGVKTDQYGSGEKTHATDKSGLDIQSDAAKKSKSNSAKATGGEDHATAQKDFTGSTEKAKKDHPEAPDVVIGMQDERGGRGH